MSVRRRSSYFSPARSRSASRQARSLAKPSAVSAAAVLHLADAGVARRQHNQLRAPEIETCSFERSQNAVGVAVAAFVGPGECKPRTQQGVCDVADQLAESCCISGLSDGIICCRLVLQKESVRGDVQYAGALQFFERRFGRLFFGEKARLRQ